MSFSESAGNSLIFYTGKNYAGSPLQALHGDTGELASGSGTWDYLSVAVSGGHAFVQGLVDTADSSISYLSHVEDIISANITDLAALYPSPQFPLQYLGLDPVIATTVWLDIAEGQSAPNALASVSLVGGTTTNATTLTLPGRSGVLGFVALSEGSSVVANCRYGEYITSTGTVNWTGSGAVVLEYLGGAVSVISATGFPSGWTFNTPQMQGDGSWKVVLNGGSASTNVISDLTSDKTSITDNGTDIATLTATVKDSISGQPVSGVMINWTTSLGNLSVPASTTNTNGQATTLLTDNNAPGTATITAAIPDQTKLVSVTVTESFTGLTLFRDMNWQGDSNMLAEHNSTLLRDPLYTWNWKSLRIGGERLISHTLLTDISTFDFRTYRDVYSVADTADLTTNYPSVLSAPTVQGTALGENDVVIRVLLLPTDSSQKVVACATQSLPAATLASVTNGAASVEGVLIVMDKTSGVTVKPLQVGVMGDNGLVSWMYSTSFIVNWDNAGQVPVVILDQDAPQGWEVLPCQPTANAGEFRTQLTGIQSNLFEMYCVTDALTTTIQSNSINPVGFHGTPGQSITVQVSGSAIIYGVNPVILDETGYGRLDIADAVGEQIQVTAQSGSVQQSGVMGFSDIYTYLEGATYQLTQNAPADGKTPNMIYSNYLYYDLSLSGNALFDNGTNYYVSTYPSEAAVAIHDQYSETVSLSESSGTVAGNITFVPLLSSLPGSTKKDL